MELYLKRSSRCDLGCSGSVFLAWGFGFCINPQRISFLYSSLRQFPFKSLAGVSFKSEDSRFTVSQSPSLTLPVLEAYAPSVFRCLAQDLREIISQGRHQLPGAYSTLTTGLKPTARLDEEGRMLSETVRSTAKSLTTLTAERGKRLAITAA